jgi:hypothetical protein
MRNNLINIYFLNFILVALMYRLTQFLILIYAIVYLMIYNGYQETNTSIISSITLKVKVERRNLIKRRKKIYFVFQ